MRFPTSHGAPTTPPSSSNPPITINSPYHKRSRNVEAEVLDLNERHLGQFSLRNTLRKSVQFLRRSSSRSWCCGGCDKVINGRLHAKYGSLLHRIPFPRWVVPREQFFLIDTRYCTIIPSLERCPRLTFFLRYRSASSYSYMSDCRR